MLRTHNGGPVVRIHKESIGFVARAYREQPLTSDHKAFQRRWAEDTRAEFARARTRRRAVEQLRALEMPTC